MKSILNPTKYQLILILFTSILYSCTSNVSTKSEKQLIKENNISSKKEFNESDRLICETTYYRSGNIKSYESYDNDGKTVYETFYYPSGKMNFKKEYEYNSHKSFNGTPRYITTNGYKEIIKDIVDTDYYLPDGRKDYSQSLYNGKHGWTTTKYKWKNKNECIVLFYNINGSISDKVIQRYDNYQKLIYWYDVYENSISTDFTNEYDSKGNLIFCKNNLAGIASKYQREYSNGLLVKEEHKQHRPRYSENTSSDSYKLVYTFTTTYDSHNRIKKSIKHFPESSTNVTEYFYNRKGQLIKQKLSEFSSTINYKYNKQGLVSNTDSYYYIYE